MVKASPRAALGRVMAHARPDALPVPPQLARRNVSAFTRSDVLVRWADEAASARVNSPRAQSVIEIYDVIGVDYWGGGVTEQAVAEQLRTAQGQPVEVRINSGGGDMFVGIAIYNLLRAHDGEVTIKIVGMAASAASIIAMAGARIEIGAAAFLMIHNCWVLAVGNQFDLRATADVLAPFDDAMAGIYAARTGKDRDAIAAMLKAETWIGGDDAVAQGFADALLPADAVSIDEPAAARARDGAKIAAMEHALMAQGMTRAQARAHIAAVKGKPDAAHHAKPDAGAEWSRHAAAFLRTIKGL